MADESASGRAGHLRVDGGFRVRLMGPGDLRVVTRIDARSFVHPEPVGVLRAFYDDQDTIGVVVEHAGWTARRVVGFLFYFLAPRRVDVMRLAVDPGARRRGVGRMLLAVPVEMAIKPPTLMVADLRETQMDGLKFLRSQGWRAMKLRRDGFEADAFGPAEDLIRLVWRPATS